MLQIGNLFGFGDSKVDKDDHPDPDAPQNRNEPYTVPVERANGRPHELGWLDVLDDEKKERVLLGKVPPGQIIMD